MPLVEHLRELRRRLVIAVLAILIGTIVGWFIYPSAFDFLKQPYVDGIAPLLETQGIRRRHSSSAGESASAFSFRLKFALVIGLVISCDRCGSARSGHSSCRRCTTTSAGGPTS